MTAVSAAVPARSGLWWAGAATMVLYVVLAAVTGGRPLFDGFAPPVPYRWLSPPPEFAAGNQQPESAERNVPMTAEGNEATNASTGDAQIIVTLPTGAVAPHAPDTTILLKLVPVDPGTLAPLPEGLKVQSNAYQVAMAFQPSGTPVTEIKAGPAIAMTAAAHGTKLLYSPDGRSPWQEAAARPFGATQGMTGPFKGDGYYVVAAPPQVRTTTTTGAGGSGGAAGIAAGAIALAGVAFAAFTLRSRSKQRQAAARAKAKALTRKRSGPPKARPRPQAQKRPKKKGR